MHSSPKAQQYSDSQGRKGRQHSLQDPRASQGPQAAGEKGWVVGPQAHPVCRWDLGPITSHLQLGHRLGGFWPLPQGAPPRLGGALQRKGPGMLSST